MIKTHKPRGHLWTNASAFQQTKEYRDIQFEECTPKSSEILYRDSDDDLSKAQRSAKRRRIEKLADDFLNGVPLFISSARPCPQSLRSTIVWNKKSSDEPKFSPLSLESTSGANEDEVIWEEQESTTEILERLNQRREQAARPVSASIDAVAEDATPHDISEIVEAQASCGPVSQQRLRVINARPSEEALRQAAALRARRVQQTNSEIPFVQNSVPCTAEITPMEVGLSTEAPVDTRQHHPTSWLSRRMSRFSFDGDQAYDDSIDELQLPGNERLFEHPNIQPQIGPERCATAVDALEATIRHQLPVKDLLRDGTTSESDSYHTASEQSKRTDVPNPSLERETSVLRNPTNTIQAPASKDAEAKASGLDTNGHPPVLGHDTPQHSSTFRVTRSATSRSARLAEKRKSVMERHDIPDVQSEPKQSTYLTAQRSQTGSTPLAYRKGRLTTRQTSSGQGEADAQESAPAREVCDVPSKAPHERLSRQDSAYRPDDVKYVPDEPCDRLESITDKWAGTQFLLNEAQKYLMVSPEKQNLARGSKDHASPIQPVETPRTESSTREPLKQLSQEPLPSTQQLIDNFEGWSTIKKPRAGNRDNLPTPTATGKAGWIAINSSRAETSPIDPSNPRRDTERQRSKLRFSMPVPPSSNDPESLMEPLEAEQSSPKQSHPTVPTPSPSSRSVGRKLSSPRGSSASVGLPQSEGITDDNLTFSTLTSTKVLSSFQPGQVERALSREPSDLSDTINDLTKDVLNVDDMVDVLSQVG